MMFATFVEEGMSQCVFLDLLHIDDNKKVVEVIFITLTISMKLGEVTIRYSKNHVR